jgi:phage terminase large subunit-like protein
MTAQTTSPRWIWETTPLPDRLRRGERAVNFVRKCRLFEGEHAGQKFPLAHWQERLIRRIYGDVDENGLRRVRTVFVFLPRSNGKTTLASSLGLLHTVGPEKEAGGQTIAAAAEEDQAMIAFRAAVAMIEQSPKLTSITRVTRGKNNRRITHKASRSTFRAISATPLGKHGLSVSCLIADELHEWQGRDLYDVLTTSMGKRREPLTIIITTAGAGRYGLGWELLQYARAVARGDVDDPSFLPVLFEAPHDADWLDEDVWTSVNPALRSGFLSIEHLRNEARRAAEMPSERERFKRLYLNIWTEGHAAGFVDMDVFDEGGTPFSLLEMRRLPLYLGCDLSISEDLSAVTALWRDGEGDDARYFTRPFTFVPSENLRERANRDRAPYGEWIESGLMTACDGAVIDHRDVEALIRRLCKLFDVRGIGFDRTYAGRMISDLLDDGLPVIDVRQGWVSQVPAVDRLERAILSRRLCHGGHKPLRWMLENAAVKFSAGGKMLQKRDRTSRIDAVAALWMAFHVESFSPAPYVPLYGPDATELVSFSFN